MNPRAQGLLRALAVVAGGLLVATSAAPFWQWWTHWIAFVPIFWALRADEPRRNAWLLLLCGTVSEAVIFSWIAETITLFSNIPRPAAWAILVLFAVVYGLPYLVGFATVQPLRRRLGGLWVAVWPAWLVLVDWAATGVILFPWQHGATQYRTPYVWHLASVTGVWGVTYLLGFFNAALGEWVYRRREGRGAPAPWLVAAAVLLAGAVGFGAWRQPRVQAAIEAAPTLDVFQVQAEHDMLWRMANGSRKAFQFWLRATEELRPGQADLVVWPEAAVPYDLNRSTAVAIFWDLVEKGGYDMVVGAGTRERAPEADMGETAPPRVFNSTYFFDPSRRQVPADAPGPEEEFAALQASGCDLARARVNTPFEARVLAEAGRAAGDETGCVARLAAREAELRSRFTADAALEGELVPAWKAFRHQSRRFPDGLVERTFSRRGDTAWWWLDHPDCATEDCAFVLVRCLTGEGCAVYPEAPHYDKMVPLPFGEYLPFATTFPWLEDLIEGPGHFRAGEEPLVFEGSGIRYATPICYEGILGYVCDRFERPDLLVNVTNDAWFGETAASDLHGMLVAVRAMELGVPVVRSTYSGVSFVALPDGELRYETPLFTEVKRVVPVPRVRFETVYAQWGDWFVALSALVLVASLLPIRPKAS